MSIRLSESQSRAVNFGDGALLVVAGPGSGKTRVLTERIRRLLTEQEGHFHILALTFTNKAANEMKERLVDVPKINGRAFIGTIHSFCAEVLVQRGKSVGIDEMPQIIDRTSDRRVLLADAVQSDPDLLHELKLAGDAKEQGKKLTSWMNKIARFKAQLLMPTDIDDSTDRAVYEAYQSAIRASDAVDFDDLLLLTHHLLTERPKVADFFRRLYAYVCVDEGQDLNFAQYQIICDLAGDEFKNIMIVGDPKQAIYGFTTADPKYLDDFADRFGAQVIELKENFRSARRIVDAARSLKPNYNVKGVLPVQGAVICEEAAGESEEAQFVIDQIKLLIEHGHPDIEGQVSLEDCAVLSRTRYGLLELEERLKEEGWRFYKQWSGRHDNASDVFSEFECCLKLLANPRNQVHQKQLADRWSISALSVSTHAQTGKELLDSLALVSDSSTARVCMNAISALDLEHGRLNFLSAFDVLRSYGDGQGDDSKQAIYEDARVLTAEWDRYLRSKTGGSEDLKAFLTHTALGTTQQMRQDGLALITVHSAKGLEFDVVFVVGMAEKIFPDYRALRTSTALDEERRNAFVAVSRSRRLLYLTYPRLKRMPWGDVRRLQPSRFLREMGLV